MNNKNSQLTGKPLRQTGQSIQEQIDHILDEKLISYIFGSIIFICFASLEWVKWFQKSPISLFLHDIIGDELNIDHVVRNFLGTKTYSKPKVENSKIYYDGTHLNIDSICNFE